MARTHHKTNKVAAFTIVELLIVIVVIGILAVIAISSYTGAQRRAKESQLTADLKSAIKKVKVAYFESGESAYPAALSNVNIASDSNITYAYTVDNTSSTKSFCLSASSGDISFFADQTPAAISAGQCPSGSTAPVFNNENPPSEDGPKAFDNNVNTKWLAFSTTMSTTFSSAEVTAPVSYSLTSANDSPGRDPRSWTLQASNDRVSWTTLDTRTNETFSGRYETKNYTFSNTRRYKHFRLNVTQNNGEAMSQVAEIRIADTTVLTN
ncbi:discoidin domain-containing protein [Candidatus Saccharibacteria bacterium]|nr:discoidin domain-containing protein [Candidatus Saccharibacteria bacterium]